MHNLYYVDFPYEIGGGEQAAKPIFILIQNEKLNARYRGYKKVFQNNRTHVTLYQL